MRFGFFDQLPRADWQSESQRYEDILAQIELGDELGLDTAWLGELHFIPGISCLPSPLMVLSAAAQRRGRCCRRCITKSSKRIRSSFIHFFARCHRSLPH